MSSELWQNIAFWMNAFAGLTKKDASRGTLTNDIVLAVGSGLLNSMINLNVRTDVQAEFVTNLNLA